MENIKRTTSLLTGKKNLEHLYTLKDFPVFMGCVDHPESEDKKADMSFSICPETGIIQLDTLLPLEVIYQAQHNDGVGRIWQDHYLAFSEFLEQFSPRYVLEIGGGGGTIAKNFTLANPKATWTILEPNPIIESQGAIEVVKGWFDDSFQYTQPLDTIVHSHVLEHAYEPVEFINQIASFLKPGQKHIFTFPNMVEQLSRKYTNCLNFEHTAFLAEPFVDYLLQKAGFKIIKKEYFQDHSIFYATEKSAAPIEVPTLQNHYEEYKTLFSEFINYHKALITNLNQEIGDFKGSIYLFGAHIFSLYLLGFGLNKDRISTIIDNSELKNKKRLYGTSFVIEYPTLIKGLPHVAVILKVGAYRNEVVSQLQELNPSVIIME